MLHFEEVQTNLTTSYVYRARVPGGWLVMYTKKREDEGGLTFVPDFDHRWSPGTSPL